MENIINLLWDKNYHLQRFYEMNETELANFVEGQFDNLEQFYNSREAILDLIGCIDRLIDQAHHMISVSQVTQAHKEEVTKALNSKDDLVHRILSQDLQILSVLEAAKSNIIKELSQVKAARKAMSAYHSGQKDGRLDEEV